MKDVVLMFLILFVTSSCSQKKIAVKSTEVFTQQITKKKGLQLLLKNVVNDSRCPEGVNCIWAGEIEIVVSVYNDNIFIKDEKILLSPKLHNENIAWFSAFYPNQKISEILVLPYPKSEVVVNPKNYFVKIIF